MPGAGKMQQMKRILIALAITLVVGFLLGGYTTYTFKTKSNDKKANEFFVEGQKDFDSQKYPEAAEMFNRSIGLKSDLDSAHAMLSNTYQKMGLNNLAKKELESSGIKNSQ